MVAKEIQNYLAGYYLTFHFEDGVVETDVEMIYPRGYQLRSPGNEQ